MKLERGVRLNKRRTDVVRGLVGKQWLIDIYVGLPMSEVHNAEWFRVEQRMEYHQAPTDKLLELWLADRLAEQARTPLPSPYGSILVRWVVHFFIPTVIV